MEDKFKELIEIQYLIAKEEGYNDGFINGYKIGFKEAINKVREYLNQQEKQSNE